MKKRKIMLGLLLTASIIGLASCGSEEPLSGSSSQAQESSTIVASSHETGLSTEASSQATESSAAEVSSAAQSSQDEASSTVAQSSQEIASSVAQFSSSNIPSSTQAAESSIASSSAMNFSDVALANYSVGGVINDLGDFSKYKDTTSYVRVTNETEFLNAIYNARNSYTNDLVEVTSVEEPIVRNNVRKNEANWKSAITKGLYIKNEQGEYIKIPDDTPYDPEDTVYTASMTYYEDSPYSTVNFSQTLNQAATIHVIEIDGDLDLGYNRIKDLAVPSVFENWDKNGRLAGETDLYCDPDIQAAGISKINISNSTDLLIYSKNGSKILHGGFSVSSCKNVAFRNLNMDEMWMWEDSINETPTMTIGDYDAFGWAYFKISFSENIWIDHCKFGKSFDGQIDYSNPCYDRLGTYSKAPYQGTGANGLHISFCEFGAGDGSSDGYIYKMMDRLEQEYQIYSETAGYQFNNKSGRYYFTLRDAGLSFKKLMTGVALPQKKAFLWGDSGDPYIYNKYLQVSMTSCVIKNIEDRLPKVRGGMAYVYNTLVDNTEYYGMLSKLKGIQSTVTGANSKYKLAAVSQGILAGLDASVYLDSVEYKGINNYLKNNDSANDKYPTTNGGYMIKNSIIGDITGSTDKTTNTDPFSSLNVSSSTLSIANFQFKVNGEKQDSLDLPISITPYDLLSKGSLSGYFTENPAGINTTFDSNFWLTTNYLK